MTRVGLHAVDAGEVMTVAVGGWLAGSFVFGIGLTLFSVVHSVVSQGASTLLLFPMALFFLLFGIGLVSVAIVLPVGIVVAALLRLSAASGLTGLVTCTLVGAGYAAGLLSLSSDWQWWKDFWFAAPLYGVATGIIYARTCNG